MSKLNFDNETDVRRKKLSQLRLEKFSFPNDFRCNYTSKKVYDNFEKKTCSELEQLNISIKIAGRIIRKRIMGKAAFIILKDSEGYIQLYITSDSLSKELYEKNIKQLDLGDILGVHGILFKTRTGELSIYCKFVQLLTKSLRPLPNKFHGLHNQEKKYRQRYLDLIVNDQTKRIFKIRSLIVHEIRQFMTLNNFMEVETPMMHIFSGGASACPFKTHHNKLGIDMYLRIAPELYLKQLVIGGFERIFEINRSFRNEGISSNHNPEFTMMEIYMTYADYHDIINFMQNLFCTLTKKILGNNIVKYGNYYINFNVPFVKMTIKEAIFHYLPETKFINIDDFRVAKSFAKSFGIIVNDRWNINLIHMALFDELIISKIIQPTCIISYPIEISPLARRNDNNSMCADRFELFIAGREIANGFSELNDPEEQKERFKQQIQEKYINNSMKYNNDIIKQYDEDYLMALEYGLPPTVGVGIGIDRLVMLLTNSHTIRDVIFFPTLRPK